MADSKDERKEKRTSGSAPREITYNIGGKRGVIRPSAATGPSGPSGLPATRKTAADPKASNSSSAMEKPIPAWGQGSGIDPVFRFLWKPVALPSDGALALFSWILAAISFAAVGGLIVALVSFS